MDGNGDLYSFVSMGFDWYDARADGRCRGPGTGAVACDARQAGQGALAAHRARNAERAAQLVPGRRAADDPDSAPAQRLLALRDRGQAQFGDGTLYLSGCRAWQHTDP